MTAVRQATLLVLLLALELLLASRERPAAEALLAAEPCGCARHTIVGTRQRLLQVRPPGACWVAGTPPRARDRCVLICIAQTLAVDTTARVLARRIGESALPGPIGCGVRGSEVWMRSCTSCARLLLRSGPRCSLAVILSFTESSGKEKILHICLHQQLTHQAARHHMKAVCKAHSP